jgi:IS30 family transposase
MRRPKPARLARCPRLRAAVEGKPGLRWSPRQIAAWLKISYPGDPQMRVSHQTSCLSLFVRSRGALRTELARYLRRGRARRRPRGLPVNNGQGQLRGTVHISQRPAEASDRAVPGHWEGDLLSGTRSSTVATLAERTTRFVMLAGRGRHTAGVAADALADAITSLPSQLRRSLTWDQGKEMADHARFSVAAGVPACFCDPHSPWQRGSNESTNGLLRQYFPRSTDFRALTQRDLDAVAAELNDRPGKRSDGSHHVRHWTRRCDDRLRQRVDLRSAPGPFTGWWLRSRGGHASRGTAGGTPRPGRTRTPGKRA